jgi:hypothetical protein
MVVFGAGASKDALLISTRDDTLLPVTSELFDFQKHPAWLAYLKNYEGASVAAQVVRTGLQRKGHTVERELGSMWRQSRGRAERRQHLLAIQYYFRDIISNTTELMLGADGGQTNYIALVDRLEAWRRRRNARIAYVTFNYDRLLEAALRQVTGTTYESLDSYLDADRCVFKIHGSVNWVQFVSGSTKLAYVSNPNELIPLAAYLEYKDEFDLIANPNQMRTGADREFTPAFAIPRTGKSSFVMPLEHRKKLEEWLIQVRYVLTVGWSAREQTFLEALAAHKRGVPLEVVTRRKTSARSVGARLEKTGFTRLSLASGQTFKDLATDDTLRHLVERIQLADWRRNLRPGSR